MVKVATFFGMTFGAFLFWQTMDKVHVWIALHQDEKVYINTLDFPIHDSLIGMGFLFRVHWVRFRLERDYFVVKFVRFLKRKIDRIICI